LNQKTHSRWTCLDKDAFVLQRREVESGPTPRHGTILHFTCLAVATVQRKMPASGRPSMNWTSTLSRYVRIISQLRLSRHNARRLCRHCRQTTGLFCECCKLRKIGALLHQLFPDLIGILPRVEATQSESVHQPI
jgi:hypothetical protein